MGGRRSHQSGPAWSPLSDTHYVDGWNTSEATTKEQDWHLPIANVGRIMKKSLPGNAKISKEAKGIVQECVSEFIGFITSEASDKCRREKRKTINGDDILWAMTTLGFENYAIYLKVFMDKYRESAEGENPMATPGDQPPMEGNSSAVVAEEGDHHQSLVKEMTRKNSPKEGWLLFDGLSSNPASMQLSGVGPECYPVAAPMGQGCVGGGDVGGYGLDYPQLADFTIALGESNMIDADADVVAAALAAQLYHHHHGLAEGF